MAARKKKDLVIVESPAKAKTINKYLGTDYEVVASKGHIRDLPKSRFGIDIDNSWTPTYRVLRDRTELIKTLKKQVASAGTVYLAPDPDREGEAIAWHLKEALGLKDERTRRVTFNEITKTAIKKAFDHAGSINMDMVAAQETRRFLDRVVGYQLSPLLSRQLAQHLSAGRVQSVAVRLIVEREREIEAFVAEEYWKIAALLRPTALSDGTAPVISEPKKAVKKKPPSKKKDANGKSDDVKDDEDGDGESNEGSDKSSMPEGAFRSELVEWAGAKFQASSQGQIEPIVAELGNASYVVSKVEHKDRQERPPPPFITSTLQQQASLRLRFSAKKTMSLAQTLYQGVELGGGEGAVALITYMRTDSTHIAKEAQEACRDHIKATFGDKYLPDKPVNYTASKDAQAAHEAIRPTDLTYTPERLAKILPRSLPNKMDPRDLLKLYTLIYNRFVACQMKPAVFAVTVIEVKAARGLFRANGRTLKFDGFRRVLVPAGKSDDTLLPDLKDAEAIDLLQLDPTQHFTEPPPRYNEASLVKTLEKEGIGRPSTYATIISKIQEREYVEQKERRFYATTIGMTVNDLLVDHFPSVMDLKFTRHMEGELDLIEAGKAERNTVLGEFYEPFSQALKVAEVKMLENAEKCPLCGKHLVERFSRFGKFFGCSGHPDCKYIKKKGAAEKPAEPKLTDYLCPECNSPMLERIGRRGPFLGCSRYPDCKTTMSYDAEGNPVLASKETEHLCDKCGKNMILREGPRGPFLACSGYPKCKNAKDVDAQGNPMKPIETGINCEKCGSPMGVKRGPRGPFLGCTAYPKCRSTKKMPEDLAEKLKDVLPKPPAKKEVPQIEIDESCPECGAPMKLRPGKGSFFLGCSKYPKCKGTAEPSPELQERIDEAVKEKA